MPFFNMATNFECIMETPVYYGVFYLTNRFEDFSLIELFLSRLHYSGDLCSQSQPKSIIKEHRIPYNFNT